MRERGLKLFGYDFPDKRLYVAPVRERGLKFVLNILLSEVIQWSLP